MFSECPYFQLWIRRGLARMVPSSSGERAITVELERMQRLSSEIFDSDYSALTLESAVAVTDLLDRFRKAP